MSEVKNELKMSQKSRLKYLKEKEDPIKREMFKILSSINYYKSKFKEVEHDEIIEEKINDLPIKLNELRYEYKNSKTNLIH